MKLTFFLVHMAAIACLVRCPRQVSTASIQQRALNFHPMATSTLSLGYKRMLSSFYWITTMIQADIERPRLDGKFSWLYYRFLQISHLDPFFYENYAQGGLYLSVVKDDTLGAKDIFDRGLTVYKDDFWLNHYGAFNELFELGDLESALTKYSVLLDHPRMEAYPALRKVVARIAKSRLRTRYGLPDTMASLLSSVRHERARKKIESRLYALKAQRGTWTASTEAAPPVQRSITTEKSTTKMGGEHTEPCASGSRYALEERLPSKAQTVSSPLRYVSVFYRCRWSTRPWWSSRSRWSRRLRRETWNRRT